MILITGGAGFIGSNLLAALTSGGVEVVIADRLGDQGKWRNLARHPPARIVPPEGLGEWLDGHPPVEMVFHLGAVSLTTANDADEVWRTNVELSLALWEWCAARRVRFVYASSGATYGDGSAGFDDDPANLPNLRPLNLYGWSKHVFDQRVMALLRRGAPRPPQWAGLKFFNVYGPNEYHKGPMISVVKVMADAIAAGGRPRLYRSSVEGLADGEQKRDFLHVNDAVAVMLWLFDTPEVSGLFNVGTGRARTYLDLAHSVCRACGVEEAVEFVDMPAALRPQYQSFTEARMDRLRAAGYTAPFLGIEDGVTDYVRNYLRQPDPYR